MLKEEEGEKKFTDASQCGMGAAHRDRKALRSVVRSAEFIISRKLPALGGTPTNHVASGKLAGF